MGRDIVFVEGVVYIPRNTPLRWRNHHVMLEDVLIAVCVILTIFICC